MNIVASSPRRTDPNSVGAVSSISEQIAQAALEQFAEVGIRRSSVEDVARRAGIARVTIYRRVGGKDDLVRLVIEREASRAMDELDGALAGEQDPGVVLELGFAFLVRFVREHPLFGRLLRTEPEFLLPLLTVDGGPFLAFYRSLIVERWATMLDRGTIEPADVDRAAEAVARLALSLVLTPSEVIDADDPDAVAAFAREVLLPMLHPRPPRDRRSRA
jgi:AcrR family transcriptional regulator